MLQHLQSSVDEAERGWRDQLLTMQSENEQLTSHNKSLQSSLQDIQTAQEVSLVQHGVSLVVKVVG